MAKLAVPVLLLLLVAGGAWNYQRNAYMDEENQYRPYKTLRTEDLEVLLEAHQQQVTNLRLDRAAAPDPEMQTHGIGASDFTAKLEAFDESQRRNSHWKSVHHQVLEGEVALDAIGRELDLRERGLDVEWRRILRRATAL